MAHDFCVTAHAHRAAPELVFEPGVDPLNRCALAIAQVFGGGQGRGPVIKEPSNPVCPIHPRFHRGWVGDLEPVFSHYATGIRGTVEIESEWTAWLRGPFNAMKLR
jgi:hypothetical protein